MKKLFLSLVLSLLLANTAFAVSNQQLVIGSSQEFDTLNPVITSMVQSAYINAMLQRDLVTVDSNWKWVPLLATKIPTFENGLAQKIIDKDGKEKIIATWEINSKATWGDGTPVTGEDFKLAWQVGSNENVTVPSRDQYARIEAVTIDKTNPKRFSVKYNKAEFDYFQLAPFGILPKHIEGPIFEKTKNESGAYEKQSQFVMNPTNPGLYFGPYVVQSFRPGSDIVLTQNSYFYGPKPKIQKVVFKVIPNTQALEANLRAGSIDMISENGLSFDQAIAMEKRAQATDPFVLQIRPGSIYEHMELNLNNPILSDLRVRKALIYGADRELLVKSIFEGKQERAVHLASPNDPYYTKDIVDYPYDPAKAEQLLDEAGWKKGNDGYRYKQGQKLGLTIMSTADNKVRELVEVFLQDQWKKIGVDLKIKNEPARVFFGDTIQKMKFPHIIMFAYSSAPDMPPKSLLMQREIPEQANSFSGQNYAAYRSQKVDDLLAKTLQSFNLAERTRIMRDVLYEYTNDVPHIPLYYRAEIAVVPRSLKGFQVTGHQFFSSQEVENWDLGQ